jgi:PAS domain S-box-containing protein
MYMQMKVNAATESMVPAFKALRVLTDGPADEGCDPISISVDTNGMIVDCSGTCEKCFGYRRRDLVKSHLSRLFAEFTEIELMQKGAFNQSLVFLCRCGKLFQAQNRLGDTFSCNLNFVHLDNNGENTLRLIASPADNARAQFPYSFEY